MNQAPDQDWSMRCVLVVDDDSDLRAFIARAIQPLGVNVIEAADGRAALELLKSRSVDVIISDLIMPKMSGLMLLHTILEQGQHLPFIVITGYADKDSAIQALRLGAFDFLEKPCDANDIYSVVTEALRVSHLRSKPHHDLASLGDDLDSSSAEAAIMRMRSLRFRQERSDFSQRADGVRTWPDLKELFIREADPQLAFALSCLKGLTASSNRKQDLDFVTRVMESLRQAAEATRLNDIAQVAATLEDALMALATAPATLSEDHVALLIRVTELMNNRLAGLRDEQSQKLLRRLASLSASIRGDGNETAPEATAN